MDVREFIQNNLQNVLAPFDLTLPYAANTKLLDDNTILDYELVPSALLHFQWGNDVCVSFILNHNNFLIKIFYHKLRIFCWKLFFI